jgi:predicted alpha/beta superfamily hydrolase
VLAFKQTLRDIFLPINISFLLIACTCISVHANEKKYFMPKDGKHFVKSKYVNQTFEIRVMQPFSKKDGSERFPVVYITDGNVSFDSLKGISHSLQLGGETERFILVGINYPGDNPWAGSYLRARDLLSENYGIKGRDLVSEIPIDGLPRAVKGKKWGGADDFLSFISRELVPLIDAKYPTLKGERTYMGHSAGGYFGLYTLWNSPGLFNRYIISSPALSFKGDDFGLHEAKKALQKNKLSKVKMYLSAGSLEEHEPAYRASKLTSSMQRLAELLLSAGKNGIELKSEVIPEQSHMSVWPIAFVQGIKWVHAGVDCHPFVSEQACAQIRNAKDK